MPQNIDPNYRADSIDALNLAAANLYAEREKLRQLVRDQQDLLEVWDGYSVRTNAEYRKQVELVKERTKELLGE